MIQASQILSRILWLYGGAMIVVSLAKLNNNIYIFTPDAIL